MPATPLQLDGLTDIPPGKIAAIVTFLELRERPAPPPERPDLRVRRLGREASDGYRRLFARIGQDWLWFSRLIMAEPDLLALIADPDTGIDVLEDRSGPIGLVETVRQGPDEAKIAFFGVVAEAQGTGAARFLMRRTLQRLRADGVERVWLHTCTFDHPAAMRFYLGEGFRAFRVAVEIADDPRLNGLVPRSAAPHIPVIAPGGREED